MRIRYRFNKLILPLLFVVVCLSMSLGYALITGTLSINGTLGVSSTTFDIYFANIANKSGVTPITEPTISGGTSVYFKVPLKKRGDYYGFTVDIVNAGSIDAMIDSIVVPTITETQAKYLEFNYYYYDYGSIPSKYDKLDSGDTIKLYVEARYKDDVLDEDMPLTMETINLTLTITYVPKDEHAKDIVSLDFASMPWAQIQRMVRSNNLSLFNVGDTKCIALEGFATTNDNGCEDGKFLVRIANMSTPSECAASDFSQSACGFVVEFVDIITTHYMNHSGVYGSPGDSEYNYGSNRGGWPESEMYKYINPVTDDESSGTIYKALPSELRSVIKDTRVVSGHGSEDASNFISTDKLYLLATAEVWSQGSSNMINYDSARDKTRQLDYYANLGVTTSNYSGAIKKQNGSAEWYWLRAPISESSHGFYSVRPNGGWSNSSANSSYGVAVAFRIG